MAIATKPANWFNMVLPLWLTFIWKATRYKSGRSGPSINASTNDYTASPEE